MSEINLMHGDCMELMASKPDGFYDLAIVDPPYGLDKKSTTGAGKLKHRILNTSNIKRWDNAPSKEYFTELIRVSKNQIIWGGNYFDLPTNRCFIIWDKKQFMPTFSRCEYAWTSFNKPAKIFENIGDLNKIHPTQKPQELYRYLLKNYAKPNDKILDTHGGSFNHAKACHDMNFDLDIIEIDEDYFKAGQDAFKNHTDQIRMF